MSTGVMDKAVGFVIEHLKKNPDMSMSELRTLGSKQGINVYPVVIGKAKSALGMGKAKRGPKPGARRGRPPGRPAKVSSAGSGGATLADVATMVRELQDRLADATARLAKIASIAL